VRLAPETPRRLIGDAGRIRQALMNLVANAIKFTHSGHVLIDVEALDRDAESARLRFTVEDSGIGIPADKLVSVFEKFTQADGSITRRYGGTGLGLAIAKQLVEMMHGEIGVASASGAGSTFSFSLRLPLDREAPPAAAAADLEHLRILVVHPHERARAVLVEQLRACRARAAGVGAGGDALAALGAAAAAGDPFRVAIVADNLEEPTPEALAAAIRSDPALGWPSLLALTTIGRPGGAERARAAGFDGCLTRPARPSQLASVLSSLPHAVPAGAPNATRPNSGSRPK
jgi:CheY-like chemotaxis protein